jgi:hypothetical protein
MVQKRTPSVKKKVILNSNFVQKTNHHIHYLKSACVYKNQLVPNMKNK